MMQVEATPLEHCHMVDLPRIVDPRGSLSVVEGGERLGFDIKRVYYLYDVPAEGERGAHGHRALQQLFIPLLGGFDITLDDGHRSKRIRLDNPARALYVAPMIWRELANFDRDAVCLVLASMHYDERDYFRDYGSFLREARK